MDEYYQEAMDVYNRPVGTPGAGEEVWEELEDGEELDVVYRVDKGAAADGISTVGGSTDAPSRREDPGTAKSLKAEKKAKAKGKRKPARTGSGTAPENDQKTFLSSLSPTPLKDAKESIKNMIPEFIITHRIASGGFATVYRATDSNGKKVALKLPKFLDETVDMSVLKNFEKEASIWKKLNHRNIVEFFDGGLRPVPYMSIELMEGGNLAQLLKKHRFAVSEAVGLMLQILDGMAFAHRMASVHRDIKPENILFTAEGIPKITDWGIGKVMASEMVTKTVGTKGTLAYGSPEQVSIKKYGEVDWRTDVFQLGTLMYEMLTGKNPFMDNDPLGVISKITGEDPVPPSELNPKVSGALDDIVMKALQKMKKDRWASADVMYDRLKSCLSVQKENVAKYRRALSQAAKDGKLSRDERDMLAELRGVFGISVSEHKRMLREMVRRRK